jgi:hypothetical protein
MMSILSVCTQNNVMKLIKTESKEEFFLIGKGINNLSQLGCYQKSIFERQLFAKIFFFWHCY